MTRTIPGALALKAKGGAQHQRNVFMLNVMTPAAAPAACDAAVCELSDAELDLVAAAGGYHGSLVNISIGNIALGFQVNNQVNIAILSIGSVQGGSQTNINNAGNLVAYFRH